MVAFREGSQVVVREPVGRSAGRLRALSGALRRTGVSGPLAILLAAVAGLVAGGTSLAERALIREVTAWRAALRLVVEVRATDAAADPARLIAPVQALPGIAQVRYVSAEAALADLRRYLGPTAGWLGPLPANPLPARLEITPVTTLDAAGLAALLAALRRLPATEEVQAALGWVAPAERLLRGVRRVGWGLAGLVGLAAILAVAAATAAVRQAGAAGDGFWSRPGAREARRPGPPLGPGIVLGGSGAALAIGVLVLLSERAGPGLGPDLPALLGFSPLPAPPWSLQAGLLAGGCLLGLLGGLAGRRR